VKLLPILSLGTGLRTCEWGRVFDNHEALSSLDESQCMEG